MDAAIRAYLPQTQESTEDPSEIMIEASLDEIDIASVELPTDHREMISELADQLAAIERKLSTPTHQITRAEDEFYFQLALAYQSLGNEPSALQFYKKAVEANAYHLEAQQRLASLAATRGLYAEEQQALRAAETIDPLNLKTLDAKVRHLIRLGDLQKALEVTLSALRVDPHHVGFWSQRAGIFLALGETAKAVDAQIKAVKHAPERSQSYQRLATVLASAGDLKSSALARHKAQIAAESTPHKPKPPPYRHLIKSLRKLDDDVRV
jgi:tetratricopeptide (TPR) repeat protein